MNGILTKNEEWLYPDMPLSVLPGSVTIHTAKNGKESVRLVLEAATETASVIIENCDMFTVEQYQLLDVPVEYNCESSTAQDGFFVITDPSLKKPDYCTRKAPFRVYDVQKPINGVIAAKDNVFALCLTFCPKAGIKPRDYKVKIILRQKEDVTIEVNISVYNVLIPKETLKITNWFNIPAIAEFHDVEINSSNFLKVVRQYAKAMRRVRQTHFFITFDWDICAVDKGKYSIDFSRLKPIIEIFFEEGMTTMEMGNFAVKHDTLFTDELKCSLNKDLTIASDEGYYFTVKVITQLSGFLKDNNWEDKVIFHICDEPDVHVSSPEVLEKRKQQYFKVANLLRKYIPGCKIIEAVKSPEFKSGIDIWVPLTANYEEFIRDFDSMAECGDEIWNYVCCCPSGYYLNRFLDIELLRSRLIFWGCSYYNLSGYLHWGFNCYPTGKDPFEQSCSPNVTGHGTTFPSGDAYIVYPGENGEVWPSVRFEAQRKGAEDFELLKLIKNKDMNTYQDIIEKVFRSNLDYIHAADEFEEIRKEILCVLEEK